MAKTHRIRTKGTLIAGTLLAAASGLAWGQADTYDITLFDQASTLKVGLGAFDFDNTGVTGLFDTATGVGGGLVQISFAAPPGRGAPTQYREVANTDFKVNVFMVRHKDTKGANPIRDANEIDGNYVEGLGAGTQTAPTPPAQVSRLAGPIGGPTTHYVYFYLFNPQTGVGPLDVPGSGINPDDNPDLVFRKVWCLYPVANLGGTSPPGTPCPDGAAPTFGFYGLVNRSTPKTGSAPAPGTLVLILAGLAAAAACRHARRHHASDGASRGL